MPKAVFTGGQQLTYMQYFDAATGKTLVCDPGGEYDIFPDVPPDGRFIPVEEAGAEELPPPSGDEEDSPDEPEIKE